MTIFEHELVVKAREFAYERHEGQTYGDDKPFTYHLEKVVETSQRWYRPVPEIAAACYLHDVLEDTDTTFEELSERFGDFVANTVYDVTDEEGENRFDRWCKTADKIRQSHASVFVKLCDRYSNMSESLATKHTKLEMYVKEYPLFKVGIYTPYDWQEQWKEMDELYKLCKEVNNG